MKKLSCFLLIIIICVSFAKAQRVPPGLDWKLTDDEASEMLERLSECGVLKPCHNSSKVIDPNNDVYNWIVSTYGGNSNITKIDARYRDNDEDRYKRLRGITDSKKAKVRGWKTLLVKVEPPMAKGSQAEVMYFDCYTICPPPSDCSEAADQ